MIVFNHVLDGSKITQPMVDEIKHLASRERERERELDTG